MTRDLDTALAEIKTADPLELLDVLRDTYLRQRADHSDVVSYYATVLGLENVDEKLARLKQAENERIDDLFSQIADLVSEGKIK